MMKRVCVFLLALLLAPTVQAAKVINIGIVTDGVMEQGSWSPALFKNELLALTGADFDVRFPKNKQLNGGWSAQRITAALKQLEDDPKVDMVLALGYVSSAIAVQQRPLRKPTFAPFIMDANLLGVPSKEGGSGIKNLNYLSSGANFVRDLKVMNSVAQCHDIAVFLGKADYEAQPGLINRAREVTAAAGVKLQFIQLQDANDNPAQRLPPGVECVVLASQGQLTTPAIKAMIETLIEKKLPSYSLADARLVEQGVLMAEAPETNWRRLARRNALNMHEVMHGGAVEDQPVTMEEKRRLIINMATARAIGVSPRFDLLNNAVQINELPGPQGRTLTLARVADEAVAANLDLRAASLSLEVGQSKVDQAKAGLRPQLGARVGHQRLNNDSTAVLSGASAEQSTSAAITLSQLIYSDSVNANVAIQQSLQQNREELKQQLELDIVKEATVTYLNLLKAQTIVHIRRENMELTRTNLELAKDRQQIGVANPAEVYRWESQLATSRRALLEAEAQLNQSQDAVNRLLHRPLNEQFIAKPATLDDPRLVVSRKELFDYVNSDRAYQLLGEFMVQQGINKAPELAALDAQLSASQRELSTNRRAYWLPTVTLQGEVSRVLDEQRLAGLPNEDKTDWSLGVNVSLPLFEGGARSAKVTGSRMTVQQLQTQRDAVRERIEQRIRVALHDIGASYPSIQLSKDAATAARKNLDLVTEAYSRGAVPILDLLDAQNAALIAEEDATNAVFDFLIDLMNLQRGAGGFDFFLDEQGLDSWLGRLKNYIETHSQE
jgi:outer membrane protein